MTLPADRFPALNLPPADVATRRDAGGPVVFDAVRRTWVALTPEEWVRQHVVALLTRHRGYPAGLLSVERGLPGAAGRRRTDIVAYARDGRPRLLVECKAPAVRLGARAAEQAAGYNLALRAPLLMVTNGMAHFCYRVDFDTRKVAPLRDLPYYDAPESSW